MDLEILASLLAFAALVVTWAVAPSRSPKFSEAKSPVPAAS